MELAIKNLSKTYPNGVQALKKVSFSIGTGMFGLLGPNGAGKSTLMRIITTLQEPDEGSIQLGEIDVLTQKQKLRKLLGYLPQEFGVYPKISAEELLEHLAILKGVSIRRQQKELVQYLLHKTNLFKDRKKNLGGFSGGMKQRFGIAQALLSDPKLIIVDEPTAGLDPTERNRFLNLLSELGEDAIVILSTHLVDDVKELCTDMLIINEGEVVIRANPMDAISKLEGKIWQKRILKHELRVYKEKYKVVSEKLIAGMPEIHVYSETGLNDGFKRVQAELKDVYFSKIFESKT